MHSRVASQVAGDLGSFPGSGSFPGKGNGNPLQDSCLGNPMVKGTRGLLSVGSQRAGRGLVTE